MTDAEIEAIRADLAASTYTLPQFFEAIRTRKTYAYKTTPLYRALMAVADPKSELDALLLLMKQQPSPPPPPPPPPPPTGVIQGLGTWQQGGHLAVMTNKDKYSHAIVGLNDNVAALAGKALVYTTGMQVPAWNMPMSLAEARSNGWLLHSNAGAEIPYSVNSSGVMANVANANYAARWVELALVWLAAHPEFEGVYLDNFVIDIDTNFTGIDYPLKDQADNVIWRNQPEFAASQVAWLAIVGKALKAAGYYFMVNAAAGIPGTQTGVPTVSAAGTDNGAMCLPWIDRLAPHISGYMVELWQQYGGSTTASSRLDRTDVWYGNWAGWQAVHAHCNLRGIDFHGFSYVGQADLQKCRYLRGSFLLEWDGEGGSWVAAPNGAGDNWNPVLALRAGRPTGPKEQLASLDGKRVWARNYSGGDFARVIVNPQQVAVTVEGRTIASGDAAFA